MGGSCLIVSCGVDQDFGFYLGNSFYYSLSRLGSLVSIKIHWSMNQFSLGDAIIARCVALRTLKLTMFLF